MTLPRSPVPGRRASRGFVFIPVLVLMLAIFGVYLLLRSFGGPEPGPEAGPEPLDAAVPAGRGPAPVEPVVPAAAGGGDVGSAEPRGNALDPARAAMRRGDYADAVRLFRDAGGGERADRGLASALNALAVERYGEGELTEARDLLKEAAGLVGGSGRDGREILVNLASVHLALSELESAERIIEGVGPGPRTDELRKGLLVLRARESRERGDPASALDYLERAFDLDPSDERLAEAVKVARDDAEATEGFTTARGGRFIVRYEGGENAVAGHLVGILLEEAYLKVGSDLGYYPDRPVEALVYTDRRFRDVTGSPDWAGAIYDGRIKIPAGGLTDRTSALEKVVIHEYTHAVVHMLSQGRAPVWLNEGLAQYEEGEDLAGAESRLASAGRVPSLGSLEGGFTALGTREARTAYDVSLSAAAYLVREYGAGAARRALEETGRGETIGEALRTVIFISYEEFERSWLRYLSRRSGR